MAVGKYENKYIIQIITFEGKFIFSGKYNVGNKTNVKTEICSKNELSIATYPI